LTKGGTCTTSVAAGIAHNTPRMAWAYKNTEREKVGINC
jgi:hypothetical protein